MTLVWFMCDIGGGSDVTLVCDTRGAFVKLGVFTCNAGGGSIMHDTGRFKSNTGEFMCDTVGFMCDTRGFTCDTEGAHV